MRRPPLQALAAGVMRLMAFLHTAFGLYVAACLAFAGWALWSAGLLDGPVARDVRTSSVYVAPALDVDEEAAEQIIGNRRLVVVFLEPGADLRDTCRTLTRAAAGTLVVVLSPADGEYDRYSCAFLGAGVGRSAVMETTALRGVDAFADRPLEALKVIVLNYDLLVKAGTIPDDARTVSPSLPRYVIAAAAVLTVVAGSTAAYVGARRAGRLTARYLARREQVADRRRELSAALAVLAQQIIDLDRRLPGMRTSAARQYRQLATEYAELATEISTAAELTGADITRLSRRVDSLSSRCRKLARV